MKCDFCGQETDKNYFTDDFTILCRCCAESAGIYGGQAAADYIKKKAEKKLQNCPQIKKSVL